MPFDTMIGLTILFRNPMIAVGVIQILLHWDRYLKSNLWKDYLHYFLGIYKVSPRLQNKSVIKYVINF